MPMRKPKSRTYKNGAHVSVEREAGVRGMYAVLLRDPDGEVHTKVRCDDVEGAEAHYSACCKIAPGLKSHRNHKYD
jgi:hypothetical protein